MKYLYFLLFEKMTGKAWGEGNIFYKIDFSVHRMLYFALRGEPVFLVKNCNE